MDNKVAQTLLSMLSAMLVNTPNQGTQLSSSLLSPELIQALPVLLPQVQSELTHVEEYLKESFTGIRDKACAQDLHLFAKGLLHRQSWALQMADATAKMPQSLMSGVSVFPGDFDGCAEVGAVRGSHGTIGGRYCLISTCYSPDDERCSHRIERAMSAAVEMRNAKEAGSRMNVSALLEMARGFALRWGVCAPSSCSALEIRGLAQRLAAPLRDRGVRVNMADSDCTTDGPVPLPDAAIMLLLGSFTLGIGASVYEWATDDKRGRRRERWRPLVAFSLVSNARSLVSMNDEEKNSLPPLHGVRVIAMLAVVTGHRYLWALSSGLVLNGPHLHELWRSYISLLLKVVAYSVDVFLVLSGLLVTYVACSLRMETKRMNWLVYYSHRLIRLWPLLAATIYMQTTVLPHLGDGPIWQHQLECDVAWWPIVLFVSNFFELHRCVGYTWYVAMDTQLYFMTPALLLLLWWRPKLAIRVMALLAVLCIAIRFWVVHHYEMTAVLGIIGGSEKSKAGRLKLMQSPYCRYSTFLMGMILGYKLHLTKYNGNLQGKSRRCGTLLWAIVWVLVVVGSIITHEFSQLEHVYHPLWDPLVISLLNNSMALAVCIIIYLCCTGRGGCVGKVLSCKIWQPLSRLTYAVYMVNVSVVLWSTGTFRAPIIIHPIHTTMEAVVDYVLSLIVAFPLSLFFESPIIRLERILVKREIDSSAKKDMNGSVLIKNGPYAGNKKSNKQDVMCV